MSSDEQQTRDEIEDIGNDGPPVQEPVQETVIETSLEEEAKPGKAKPKAKAKAKPKIKRTKGPATPINEEVVKAHEVEEKPTMTN